MIFKGYDVLTLLYSINIAHTFKKLNISLKGKYSFIHVLIFYFFFHINVKP